MFEKKGSSLPGPATTIENFVKPENYQHVISREYGLYNRPNFYVRMFNGLGDVEELEESEEVLLENAKKVLSKMTVVLVFGGSEEGLKLAFNKLFAAEVNVTQSSNNQFSSHFRYGTSDEVAPPPSEHYRATFNELNKLDIALYQWALKRFNAKYSPNKREK
uniref:Uncharacterized protein n=1 Tax=Paramoeba aestuarina TaxID=180227 RepID=A0A7S4L8Y0_9EUKA|mmetsp:Transcript_33224/g.51940  ORF Transcript_33224/g.51940 Transcript_33224/m.51940 type:complete len:162 (+) Transcript_33224:324-809(+)